jgi:hypothetical protein
MKLNHDLAGKHNLELVHTPKGGIALLGSEYKGLGRKLYAYNKLNDKPFGVWDWIHPVYRIVSK